MTGPGCTLFVSDLHLDAARPRSTDLFLGFLAGEATQADALYILGDLFEYWLGDDVRSDLGERVADGIARLGDGGVPCHFMRGNRDFLISGEYAGRAGMSLLPDEHVVDLYGRGALLLHGDTLCTDDTAYQQTRARIRHPQWRREFLAKSAAERIAFARDARAQSERYKQQASDEIMDVNPGAVTDAFARHGVRLMIHGHTHRPALHELATPLGPGQRIVLGDWYQHGSVLRLRPDGADLAVLS